MWNHNPIRRPMLPPSGNYSPRSYFPPNSRYLPPPSVNPDYAPGPFYRNSYPSNCSSPRPKCERDRPLWSVGLDHRSDDTSVSLSTILRMPYSPGQNTSQGQGFSPTQSPEPYARNVYNKSEAHRRFSIKNSPPPGSPFLSENKGFGIPFISDAAVDVRNSPLRSNHSYPVSSITKQEDNSFVFYYNKANKEENHGQTPTSSCEKANFAHDDPVFSQKSSDSFISEGSFYDATVNEDSQSRPILGISSADMPKRKTSSSLFSEDSCPASADSAENSSKRMKVYHPTSDIVSELEKHISEVSDPVVGLDYIMEFQKENVPPVLYTYKCSLCNTSLLSKHVLMHIIGMKHRLKFLKTKDESKHREIIKLHERQEVLAGLVMEAVAELEREFGRGSVKVITVTTCEAKNNEEMKTIEEPSSISPEISTTHPVQDEPVLDKIPEPPDLKLLSDILSTAQSLQTGSSKEFFHFPEKTDNEKQEIIKPPQFGDPTVSTKWPLECGIPPPPPLSVAEEITTPWSHLSPPPLEMCSSLLMAQAPSHVNSFSATSSQLTSPIPPGEANRTEISDKNEYVNMSSIFVIGQSESPVENRASEVHHSSSAEFTPNSLSTKNSDSPSTESSSILKKELFPDCKVEPLPKIPLIGDSLCDVDEVVSKMPKSPSTLAYSKIMPFINGLPNHNEPCVELTEQEMEMGKAAIFESLSRCTVTNEAEAELVKDMIKLLWKSYLRYILQGMPPEESESLSQALLFGDKDAVAKLQWFLNERHNQNVCKKPEDELGCVDSEMSSNEASSSINPLKYTENEDVKTSESYSSSMQGERTKSVPALVTSQGSSQQLNEDSIATSSLPAVPQNQEKMINSTESTVSSFDSKNANIILVNELENQINSSGHAVHIEKESPSDAAKFTLAAPPPPPPLPESVPQAQVTMPEQQNYVQACESSVQMTSYGGWPMTFYAGASQTGGYMYWPAQNIAGMDPSLMNAQFILPAQNTKTGLYSWCTQPSVPLQESSHLPPLPPPPPPPPPPPSSTAS